MKKKECAVSESAPRGERVRRAPKYSRRVRKYLSVEGQHGGRSIDSDVLRLSLSLSLVDGRSRKRVDLARDEIRVN